MERLTLENAINRSRKLAERHRWNSENTKLETSDENANEVYKNTCIQYANQEEQYAEWLEELKSYKDLEEQGLLVRLPCKVGAEVYYILGIPNKMPCAIDKCVFELSDINKIGKTLFLTREEAEKKLEKLKNEI